ncbi:hypothetical protein JYU29_13695 [Tianweitania sp. BSSL-BM11]|uniref:Uncharacterized protein n=1 Tax=Tianweitania aestuarii TaxID=2814886 RepID=A0ABS5RXI5_9HYPH|nr:hypothetical protein [Tianweitania aestuarii]MBS9721738.1 hypothetical protein [Tianweitania aestuarii]
MNPDQAKPADKGQTGPAVDNENPGKSPMEPGTQPTGPAQPFDVEHVESDRAKSRGPRLGEGSS